MQYRIRIRYFGKRGSAGGSYAVTLRAPSRTVPADVAAESGDEGVELAIPLRELNYPRSLAVCVETSIAGLAVDNTGYRFLSL
jgi:hypothetical protein